MNYAVYLISSNGVDQQVSTPLTFQEATELSMLCQADAYLEDPEFPGEIHGNYVVMPCSENRYGGF